MPKQAYKFTTKRREEYLVQLREGSGRCAAAKAVGVCRQTVYHHRLKDRSFADAEQEAELEANEQVENALYMAAMAGNVVACQVWLYNRMPERWQDRRKHEHGGENGGPITIRVVYEGDTGSREKQISKQA